MTSTTGADTLTTVLGATETPDLLVTRWSDDPGGIVVGTHDIPTARAAMRAHLIDPDGYTDDEADEIMVEFIENEPQVQWGRWRDARPEESDEDMRFWTRLASDDEGAEMALVWNP